MTLQEIKDEYAKEQEYLDWDEFEIEFAYHEMNEAVNEIAKRYAKSKLEEVKIQLIDKTFSMEKTAEILFRKESDFEKGNKMALENFRVHIKSILETPLENQYLKPL